uniref:Uncharacterized protein n=1 Tax=Anguilla anguilla TaxID=7936 RepID=A0A0E9TPP1_ANGAN
MDIIQELLLTFPIIVLQKGTLDHNVIPY